MYGYFQVSGPPFDRWHPPFSTTTSRPSITTTYKDDKDQWGTFGEADWFNNWGHGWDQNWPYDWSTKTDTRPIDAKDPFSSSDIFPSTKESNLDNYEDSDYYVPEETLLQTLLKNHRFSNDTTLHPIHNPQQTTPTLLRHYYNNGPRGTNTPLSEHPLTVTRYSEIPLTNPKPHKNRGSSLAKHKHRYPPHPFVRHLGEYQGKNRPLGARIPPVRTHRGRHKVEATERTSVLWRPSFAGMVPVATKRRRRCVLCH